MSRIFTITEGVENLGALKSGGQGSVYKGKRIGEIFTAIKILPTPIYSETAEDKNFVSFQNEVQKLLKVNEIPNPNVVTILSSGITDSGNLPFIEMEYIDGDDLGEILSPPHDPVFSISEALKLAEQLSNALCHCHRAGVRHGDIKSNNVKFNIHTGNYILIDFGLSVMSDEQRRTSLRHAGAIEFMAPEQNEGHMLFETDVYSFGVILYEVLAGRVPFPLKDNGETSRNAVMVAHMETSPPDLLSLRTENIPASWTKERREKELLVPEWLIRMIYKCLEKDPANRFKNGIELHEHISHQKLIVSGSLNSDSLKLSSLYEENIRLKKENEQLLKQLQPGNAKIQTAPSERPGKSKSLFSTANVLTAVVILLCLAVVAYSLIWESGSSKSDTSSAGNDDSSLVEYPPENAEINAQLKIAAGYVESDSVGKALVMYKRLASQDIPEAMYMYGDLSLKHYGFSSCAEAFDYLLRAGNKNHPKAKRTLGFLYAFADESSRLKSMGYDRCEFRLDAKKGAGLLIEAVILGDSTANRLLRELNDKETGINTSSIN